MKNLTIKEYLEGYKNKQFSVSEIVKQHLDRMKSYDDTYAYIAEEQALKQAEQLESKSVNGKLYGIPMAMQDVVMMKSMPMQVGSKILKDFQSPFDADIVQIFEANQSVCLGKIQTPEFIVSDPRKAAQMLGNVIKNNLASFALGIDVEGSVTESILYNEGVVLVTSFELLPSTGIVPITSSFDRMGILTKSIEDLALILDGVKSDFNKLPENYSVYEGEYEDLLSQDIKGMSIGVPKEYLNEVDEDTKKKVMNQLSVLEKLGANIKEISLDSTRYVQSVYDIVSSGEFSTNMSRYDGIRFGSSLSALKEEAKSLEEQYLKFRSSGLGDVVQNKIMLGAYFLLDGQYNDYYVQALKVRSLIINDFKDAFEDVDVLCTPVISKNEKTNIASIAASCAGLPSLALSADVFGNENDNVPMQFIAPQFAEDRLLKLSNKMLGA